MRLEEHEKSYEEHLKNINRLIEEGAEENQRNIAYNISQGSGDQLDHRVFKSKTLIGSKIPQDFPSRNDILELMRAIDTEIIALCYGNRKPKERVEKLIEHFNELKRIINKNLQNGKK